MIDNIEEFMQALPPMRALIGLDLGTKTIGLAMSDRLLHVASPSHVLPKQKFNQDAKSLREFIDREEVGGIVLGLPSNMNGTNGPRVQATKGFAYNLRQTWGENMPPLLLWDERLSTVEAERAMISADMSRAKRAEKIDAVAAAIILQGALDRINVLKRDRNDG